MVRGAERRKLRKESDPGRARALLSEGRLSRVGDASGAAYAAPKQEKPKPKAAWRERELAVGQGTRRR